MPDTNLALLIDALDKVGLNTDSAAVGTLFGKLAKVIDYVDSIPVSPIKSIQRGYVNIPNGSLSADVLISAVNTGKSLVFHSFRTAGTAVEFASNWALSCDLTSSTNIHLERATNTNDMSIVWVVVEYN